MRLTVLFVVLCGLAAAYVPSSFRSQSTAGLWADDYDLLFEPARIPLIRGDRVYTALSNLVSGNDQQFRGSTNDFFLLGGSTSLTAPIYPGLLFDRFANHDPLATGLTNSAGDELLGEGRAIHTELLDLDSNGTYDYKREDVTSAEAWNENETTHGYFGVGYKAGSLRLGAAFAPSISSSQSVDPARNYTFDRRDSSLVDRMLTYRENDTFVGFDRSRVTESNIIVNGWYDFSTVRLGVLGSFAPLVNEERHDYRGWSSSDRSPANPSIVDFSREQMLDTADIPHAGSRIGGVASLFYLPKPEIESRFYLRAYTQSLAVGADAGGLEAGRIDSFCHPGTASGYDTTLHKYRGREMRQGISVSTRQLFTVTPRLRLGLGLGFAADAWQDSLEDSTAQRSYYAYDNGDSISGREDFQSTTTFAEEWMTRTTGTDRVLTAPVGVEFKVVEPLALRLGASPTMTWKDETTVEELTASSPQYTHTIYGDSTFSDRLGDAQQNPGSSETRKSVTYSTGLTYGIGYSPIDNLQIDLMGFSRLTDLRYWRLSVTLKF
ncbi:hypothetical protein FJY68_06845 [candidate division WOR-3 bacterium]|uniref:DUF5723 domain-containing protein n=1 Tax=candidate division WOR-3 bacterium TaxID=2052148 RepID=A0A938BPV9_UNCW3|nr:hypothetical protein [candidate division WOR-3 bacterium]